MKWNLWKTKSVSTINRKRKSLNPCLLVRSISVDFAYIPKQSRSVYRVSSSICSEPAFWKLGYRIILLLYSWRRKELTAIWRGNFGHSRKLIYYTFLHMNVLLYVHSFPNILRSWKVFPRFTDLGFLWKLYQTHSIWGVLSGVFAQYFQSSLPRRYCLCAFPLGIKRNSLRTRTDSGWYGPHVIAYDSLQYFYRESWH